MAQGLFSKDSTLILNCMRMDKGTVMREVEIARHFVMRMTQRSEEF